MTLSGWCSRLGGCVRCVLSIGQVQVRHTVITFAKRVATTLTPSLVAVHPLSGKSRHGCCSAATDQPDLSDSPHFRPNRR